MFPKEGTDSLEHIQRIQREMNAISTAIHKTVNGLDGDVISIRTNPKVVKLWNRLCYLHMQGMILCMRDVVLGKSASIPKECLTFFRPQACVTALHLSEEETCCERIIKRLQLKSMLV